MLHSIRHWFTDTPLELVVYERLKPAPRALLLRSGRKNAQFSRRVAVTANTTERLAYTGRG